MEKCDQVVMDFLAATDVGKFPLKQMEERRQEYGYLAWGWSLFSVISFVLLNPLCELSCFLLSKEDNG